jgi:hypothetical protein
MGTARASPIARSRLAFDSNRNGNGYVLYEKPENAVTPEQVLLQPEAGFGYGLLDWSLDDRFILFEKTPVVRQQARPELWVMPRFGDRKPFGVEALRSVVTQRFLKMDAGSHTPRMTPVRIRSSCSHFPMRQERGGRLLATVDNSLAGDGTAGSCTTSMTARSSQSRSRRRQMPESLGRSPISLAPS